MQVKNNPTRGLLFNFLGLSISVIPVTVSIFSYFPLWIAREDASVLSGIALILSALAAIPLYKYVRHMLRSASVPFMWFCIFLVFFLLSRIADEMTVISLVGFITNLTGSLFFKLAKKQGSEQNNEGRT